MYRYYNIEMKFEGNKEDEKSETIFWRIRESGSEVALFRNNSCLASNGMGSGIKSVEGALEDIFDEIRDIVLNDAREIYEKHKMADKI